MQSLNQLQRQAKNGSCSRHEEEGKHYERRDKYRIPSHSRSASVTHRHHSPPYSTRKFHVSEIQGVVYKCLVLGIKEEYMSWRIYKERLGSSRHHPLMVKEKCKTMPKHGFLGSRDISNCTTIHKI
jgi:hypothetical protein